MTLIFPSLSYRCQEVSRLWSGAGGAGGARGAHPCRLRASG